MKSNFSTLKAELIVNNYIPETEVKKLISSLVDELSKVHDHCRQLYDFRDDVQKIVQKENWSILNFKKIKENLEELLEKNKSLPKVLYPHLDAMYREVGRRSAITVRYLFNKHDIKY